MEHKHNKNDLSCLQWLSPGTRVNMRYINSTRGTSSIQNQTKPRSRKINSPGLLLVLSSTMTLGLSSCCMPLISGGSMGFRRYTLHTAQQQDWLLRMLHTMTLGLSSPSKHAGSDSHPHWKHWPEQAWGFLHTGLLLNRICLAQNLTQWARTKPDPRQILCNKIPPSVEECNWAWTWETDSRLVAFCQNQARCFLHTG